MSKTNVEVIDFLITTKNKKGLFDLLVLITQSLLDIEKDEETNENSDIQSTLFSSKINLVNSILNGIADDASLDFRLSFNSFISNTLFSLRNNYLMEEDVFIKEKIGDSIWRLIDGLSASFRSITIPLTNYNNEDQLIFHVNSSKLLLFINDLPIAEKSFKNSSDAFDVFYDLILEQDIRNSEIIKDWS